MDSQDYAKLIEDYNRLKNQFVKAQDLYASREEENRVLKFTLRLRLKIARMKQKISPLCEAQTNGTTHHSTTQESSDQPEGTNGGTTEEIKAPEENVIEPPIPERDIPPLLPEMSAKGSYKDLITLSKFRDDQVKLERKTKRDKKANTKKRSKPTGSQVINDIMALQASNAMNRSMNPVFVPPPTFTKLDTLFSQLKQAYEQQCSFEISNIENGLQSLETDVQSPVLISYLIKNIGNFTNTSSYWDIYTIAQVILQKFLPPYASVKSAEWYIALSKSLFSFVLQQSIRSTPCPVKHNLLCGDLENPVDANLQDMLLRLYVYFAQTTGIPRYLSYAVYKFYIKSKDSYAKKAMSYWPEARDSFLSLFNEVIENGQPQSALQKASDLLVDANRPEHVDVVRLFKLIYLRVDLACSWHFWAAYLYPKLAESAQQRGSFCRQIIMTTLGYQIIRLKSHENQQTYVKQQIQILDGILEDTNFTCFTREELDAAAKSLTKANETTANLKNWRQVRGLVQDMPDYQSKTQ